MKIVVTGASGTIGQVMMESIKKSDHEGIAFDRNQVDITNEKAVNKYLKSLNPDIIYHLGKSSLEFTKLLGAWAFENQTTLIFTSSFKVFSGKKVQGPYSIYDKPDGTDQFAKDKIAQEQALFEYYPFTYVVRLAWQIAEEPKGYNFLSFIKNQMDKRGPFKASHQQYFSFMFIEDTVEYLLRLAFQYPPGLYHLNANEYYSLYDVLMNLKEKYNHSWLSFNDQKKLSKNDTMKSNIDVKTFSDYDFKFYRDMK